MATIQKVKRKQGHAYVAIINKQGVKSFSKTFKKLSNAKTWAREVESDAEYLAARRMGGQGHKTFHSVVIEYSSQYNKKDKCLLGLIDNWDSRIGHYKLYDITLDLIRSELDKYSKEIVQRGNGRGKSTEIPGGSLRSNATINKFKAALSSVFNFAIDKGSMKTNLCRDIKSRPLNNRRERYLTKQEIQALLKACAASDWDQLYLLVMMAITTGARVLTS
jgi:integrase